MDTNFIHFMKKWKFIHKLDTDMLSIGFFHIVNCFNYNNIQLKRYYEYLSCKIMKNYEKF